MNRTDRAQHTRDVGDVAAILVAAGSSTRMGGADKLWADLDGEPLVARALRMLACVPGVRTVVAVAPAERHDALRDLFPASAAADGPALCCVEGGARRQDSVAAGIAAAPDAAWYLVHDAARPLATVALARAVLAAARERGGAAIPGVAVADTIKRIDAAGRVVETVDREALRAVQTPQAFAGELLRRAHHASDDDATDDAALVERLGAAVMVINGERANLKVTTPGDLASVRALVAGDASTEDAR